VPSAVSGVRAVPGIRPSAVPGALELEAREGEPELGAARMAIACERQEAPPLKPLACRGLRAGAKQRAEHVLVGGEVGEGAVHDHTLASGRAVGVARPVQAQ
jgi:hypothetical protein